MCSHFVFSLQSIDFRGLAGPSGFYIRSSGAWRSQTVARSSQGVTTDGRADDRSHSGEQAPFVCTLNCMGTINYCFDAYVASRLSDCAWTQLQILTATQNETSQKNNLCTFNPLQLVNFSFITFQFFIEQLEIYYLACVSAKWAGISCAQPVTELPKFPKTPRNTGSSPQQWNRKPLTARESLAPNLINLRHFEKEMNRCNHSNDEYKTTKERVIVVKSLRNVVCKFT